MQKLTIFFATLIFVISANANVIRVTVRGMVCGFCAQGITKKFSLDRAVNKVDVDLNSQLITLTLKDGFEMKDAKVSELVRDAGFSPVKIERL